MLVTTIQMAKPNECEIRCADAGLAVKHDKAPLKMPNVSHLIQATHPRRVLREMSKSPSVAEMLTLVFSDVVQTIGRRWDLFRRRSAQRKPKACAMISPRNFGLLGNWVNHVSFKPNGQTMFQELMKSGLVRLVCLAAVAAARVQAAPTVLIPSESRIDFIVKEMGVPVHGGFQHFESSIDINPTNPMLSSAQMKIDVGSLTTGTDEADAIAVGPDWLDKIHTPYAIFKSSSFRSLGSGRFEARGELSLHNRTKDLVVQFLSTEQAGGKTLITSDFAIRRSEFGIGAGEWNDAGVVAEEIPVKVRLMLSAPGKVAK